MSTANHNKNGEPDQDPTASAATVPVPPLQSFAQVIAAIAARKGNTASRYNEISGHEQGLIDITIKAIDDQNKQGRNTDAVENGATAAEHHGLGTLIEGLHRYVDGRTQPVGSQPHAFAQVVQAIRRRSDDHASSRYGELSGHEQGLLDMIVQSIEEQNKHGKKADAVENGIKAAQRYGLETLIEALHRHVDGRTLPNDMRGFNSVSKPGGYYYEG